MLALGSASLLCRTGPRRWISHDNVAELIDRYFRTRFIAFVLALSLGQTFFLFSQLSLLGNLIEQVFELINPSSMAIYPFGVFWSFVPYLLLIASDQSGQLGGRLMGWPWQKRATPKTT
jgi:CDP-diglyceride synthetase